MDSIDHIRSIPNKGSTGSPYNGNLSPAAKEARSIIPENLVKERIATYNRQVIQLKASEDNATHSKKRRNIIHKSFKEISSNNTPSLNKNRNVDESIFTNLSQDIQSDQKNSSFNTNDPIEKAFQLFTPDMDAVDKAHILEAFGSIPQDRIDIVMEKAPPLFTSNMTGLDKKHILKFLASIPQDRIDIIVENAIQIFTPDMTGVDKIVLLQTLDSIPQDRINIIVEKALLLFISKMTAFDKKQILQSLTNTPLDQIDTVIEKTLLSFTSNVTSLDKIIIEKASQLFTSDMTAADKGCILEALASIPQDRIDIVIEKAPQLFTPDMTGPDKFLILHALAFIPQDRIDIVIEKAPRLFTPDMTGLDKGNILQALAFIPQDRIDIVIEKAPQLFTPNMTALDKGDILQAFASIPQDQIDIVVGKAPQLFTKNMIALDKAAVIKDVAAIPINDRTEVIKYTKNLINEKTSAKTILNYLYVISNIPKDDRDFLELHSPLHSIIKKSSSPDTCLINTYILSVDLRTSAILKEQPVPKEIILPSLLSKLSDDTLPQFTLIMLAKFTVFQIPEPEESLVMQRAIEILALANIDGEKNPYKLFLKLKELQKTPCSFEPGFSEQLQLKINIHTLSQIGKAAKVRKEHLPSKVTLDAWNTLISSFQEKINNDSKHAEEALNLLNTEKATIEASLFEENYSFLQSLFVINDTVSDIQAKWFAVLWNILDKSVLPREGEFFTEQEEVLIKTMMNIRFCKGGKHEGIALVYELLDDYYKYKITISSPEEQLELENQKEVLDFIKNSIKSTRTSNKPLPEILIESYNQNTAIHSGIFSKFFNGIVKGYLEEKEIGNDYIYLLTQEGAEKALETFYNAEKREVLQYISGLLRSILERKLISTEFLLEASGIETNQFVHIIIYLKNMIGTLIGITTDIVFDRYTTILTEDFLKKTREDLLQLFFQYVTPEFLIEELQKKIDPTHASLQFLPNKKIFLDEKKLNESEVKEILKIVNILEPASSLIM